MSSLQSSVRSALLILSTASAVFALNPLVVQQQQFLDSGTGQRFVIAGIDYQPGGEGAYGTGQGDPLSNGTRCLRDATLMQTLGVNMIRSYNLDPTLNHDECASIFNAAGIYMLLDVNSPLAGQSIDRNAPWTSYDSGYLQHIFTVVEAFKNYPNTMGFFAGNEVINDLNTGKANPPYIRAVQRDLKAYIAQHSPRPIPVGYSAAQVQEFLQDTYTYLSCNASTSSADDDGRSDFFGLNSYSWCGDSSFQTAGYNGLVSMFSNGSIPAFFSEYGCNVPAPRIFTEVLSIFNPEMTSTLSGGLVYEYTQGTDNYGLVTIDDSKGSVKLLPDYNVFKHQLHTALSNVSSFPTIDPSAHAAPVCAPSLIKENGFSTTFQLPAQPPGAADLIASGVSNPPKGTIVSVTNTQVNLPVYATDGAAITGLQLKMQKDANRPSSGDVLSGGAVAQVEASPSSAGSSAAAGASSAGSSAAVGSSSTAKPTVTPNGMGSTSSSQGAAAAMKTGAPVGAAAMVGAVAVMGFGGLLGL